jgi:hypothetical protein
MVPVLARSARVAAAIATLAKVLGDAEDTFTLRELNALVQYIEDEFVMLAQQAEWDATLQYEYDRDLM